MDIHEYQAKEILARFGVPVPPGGLAYSPEQAGYRARELDGNAWVAAARKTRAKARRAIMGCPMSVSTATSAASSTGRASPWPPWT